VKILLLDIATMSNNRRVAW